MKHLRTEALTLLAGGLLLTGAATAQRTYDQAEMKANFAEMKTHEWYTQGGWTVDFEAAKREAKKNGKPVFAYFTRTYAP